jgi:hydrogenase small subunit
VNVSRREFLKYCLASSAVLGLDPLDLGLLREALASPTGPSVIWLQGSSCTGCSVSLLNYIADAPPYTITEVLTDHINLIFHPTLMALAGEPAVAALRRVYDEGNFILVAEGGVPTAFNGHCCIVYSYEGKEITFQQAVQEHAARASQIISVGTCAAFGGIPAAGENPSGVVGVRAFTGRPTVNISGCPANPAWVVWAIVQLLLGRSITLDEVGRPVELYTRNHLNEAVPALIHDKCPRNLGGTNEAGDFGTDGQCLINLGCRGPFTRAHCENCWNGKLGQGHWCIGVNAPCHGCVEPNFPGPQSFYTPYTPT